MTVLIGVGILALFASALLAVLYDLDRVCEEAEREARLDELWDDLEAAA